MKTLTRIILILVLAFSGFWILQSDQFYSDTYKMSRCFFYPNCDCITTMFKNWTIQQKDIYLKLMRLDFIFMVFYGSLLGFWSYMEMQSQKVFWINNLLRFNLFILMITLLADITENVFSLYYFSRLSCFNCFKWSYIFTLVKWTGVTFILLTLLGSLFARLFKKIQYDKN